MKRRRPAGLSMDYVRQPHRTVGGRAPSTTAIATAADSGSTSTARISEAGTAGEDGRGAPRNGIEGAMPDRSWHAHASHVSSENGWPTQKPTLRIRSYERYAAAFVANHLAPPPFGSTRSIG